MKNTQADPQAAQILKRWTIHDIVDEVGIGYGTCQRVLTKELGMHRVAASP
jgi:hypothetical protein